MLLAAGAFRWSFVRSIRDVLIARVQDCNCGSKEISSRDVALEDEMKEARGISFDAGKICFHENCVNNETSKNTNS